MDNLEKVKRHLAKPIPIVLKDSEGNEDIFNFKPLNIEQQAILLELNKRISSREKVTLDGVEMPNMSKEDLIELKGTFIDIVMNSMPEVDKESASAFVDVHFPELCEAIERLIPTSTDKSAIEKLRKRQEELRNARTGLQ